MSSARLAMAFALLAACGHDRAGRRRDPWPLRDRYVAPSDYYVEGKEAYKAKYGCEDGDADGCALTCSNGGHVRACEVACEAKKAASCADLAMRIADSGRSAALLERACALLDATNATGNTWFCLEGGKRFAKGVGVLVDRARAVDSYRRGCKLRSAECCAGVADLCDDTTCEDGEAARARTRACKLGYQPSCAAPSVDPGTSF